jgi:hypothetical protein
MKSRCWIHRDPQFGSPQRLGNEERGFYIVFNPKQWRRERVSFICIVLRKYHSNKNTTARVVNKLQ